MPFTAYPLTAEHQMQLAELQKAQPTWTLEDCYRWGERYYGWVAGEGDGSRFIYPH